MNARDALRYTLRELVTFKTKGDPADTPDACVERALEALDDYLDERGEKDGRVIDACHKHLESLEQIRTKALEHLFHRNIEAARIVGELARDKARTDLEAAKAAREADRYDRAIDQMQSILNIGVAEALKDWQASKAKARGDMPTTLGDLTVEALNDLMTPEEREDFGILVRKVLARAAAKKEPA